MSKRIEILKERAANQASAEERLEGEGEMKSFQAIAENLRKLRVCAKDGLQVGEEGKLLGEELKEALV
eukprot:NODE_6892_length_484_cov_39.197701_g6096_i0.p2 GENE.NODE_6892_length_484_cov_39.197701_g6096_i0~~NODE_6892_length_484_cov_39.197701_g6096_i0.p2  ORF type:complete len:68 (-),score=30.30 NODE_6892_length_484_cov_39.197701_g6096_i0:99-302(-)